MPSQGDERRMCNICPRVSVFYIIWNDKKTKYFIIIYNICESAMREFKIIIARTTTVCV